VWRLDLTERIICFLNWKWKKKDACRLEEDNDFEQAHTQAERCREDVKVEVKHFEEQKHQHLNRILGDFLLAEMRFHAQALQAYIAAFSSVCHDEEDPPRGYTRSSSRRCSREKRE